MVSHSSYSPIVWEMYGLYIYLYYIITYTCRLVYDIFDMNHVSQDDW